MTTFLINTETKEKIEVLDQGIQFVEEMLLAIPKWGKKQKVTEVIMFAQISGASCSLVQEVFVENV